MSVLDALILGLVQGLTEFLPVSSSGHLVLMQHYLGVRQIGLSFDVLVHLATLLAVVVYFWPDVKKLVIAFFSIIRGALGSRSARRTRLDAESRVYRRLVWMVILGAIPAALAGFFLEDFFKKLFESVLVVGLALMATGLILWGAEWLQGQKQRRRELGAMTSLDALLIGIGQAVAIIPGISRSGTTIATALARGLDRVAAARYSFLLSLPVIFGAGLLQARDILKVGVEYSWQALAVGGVASFVAGLLAIRVLMAVLERSKLTIFSYYCWALGLVVVLTQLAK
ncbi:MAG: undecaprenyl-diphosphatase UppP [Firmicutes bacterium]|nr:undecaprenyl-diphosphatase UppP [Bacillota bacterium]